LTASDHPRARGEYCVFDGCQSARIGSPPSARGILDHAGVGPAQGWITPERAGNTPLLMDSSRSSSDHPRARGEYRGLGCSARWCSGSPPSARGIPPVSATSRSVNRDHPRARGEYTVGMSAVSGLAGSPPSARGIPRRRGRQLRRQRITPERAGNTHCAAVAIAWATDHPRARGEYPSGINPTPGLHGSPPSARGIRGVLRADRLDKRITPERAGNTQHTGRP